MSTGQVWTHVTNAGSRGQGAAGRKPSPRSRSQTRLSAQPHFGDEAKLGCQCPPGRRFQLPRCIERLNAPRAAAAPMAASLALRARPAQWLLQVAMINPTESRTSIDCPTLNNRFGAASQVWLSSEQGVLCRVAAVHTELRPSSAPA